ncbi:hypothetical protein H4R18_005208 [Coemansia javaensis]|uniref:RNI-like protein n=1 Tax=Coemansia javaensis TaxID=2761396 RepID=A0A9W8LFR6_9FUNG|nr:hypothetical protein H4R18_005208 [Coemansia javaensis]
MAPAGAAELVWHNDVILSRLTAHLSPDGLAWVSATSRRGWAYAIPRLWSVLRPTRMQSFRLLVNTAGLPLLMRIGGHQCYGSLAQTLDLAMLPGRWDMVDHPSMSRLLESCCSLKTLDMSLCQSLRSSDFERIAHSSPGLCRSLVSLDISETSFSVKSMQSALQLMPNLQVLDLTSTLANVDLLRTISEHNTALVRLILTDCIDATDEGLRLVVDACRGLKEVVVIDCPYIVDHAYLANANIVYQWEEEVEHPGYDDSGDSGTGSGGSLDSYDEMYDDYDGYVDYEDYYSL